MREDVHRASGGQVMGNAMSPVAPAGLIDWSFARRARNSWFWLAVPALVLMALFYLGPLIVNLALAFTDWSGFKSSIGFVGAENLQQLVAQDLLTGPLAITVVYAVVGMIVQNVVSLALALALEDRNRTNAFLRSVFFIPVLLSSVAVGFIWRGYLQPNGPANALLGGITGQRVETAWLAEPGLALVVVALIDTWRWFGFSTLIYIAGLNAISNELKDAARVDGASRWRLFWDIKLPLLGPALTFNITITLISAMSAFDTIMATTRGGPGGATTVLNILMLQQYTNGFYGLATSTTLVVTVLVLLVAVPLIVVLRRREVAA